MADPGKQWGRLASIIGLAERPWRDVRGAARGYRSRDG
jgi:hypothetical protein